MAIRILKEDFLSTEEEALIDGAIKGAEAKTAGEIKVIVAQKSAPENAREAEIIEAVEGRAEKLFITQGLTQTRDRTGVLFLISLDEKKVVVRGGKAINEKVTQRDWDRHVGMIIDGIRAGKPGEGIANAVRAAGELLAREFPVKEDDINEIPDHIIYID